MDLTLNSASAMNSEGLPAVHIIVMGLTGSGKSTFVMRATGDTSITTGEGLESVTKEVKSYPMTYRGREVYLIDSPGFDDEVRNDDDTLHEIANFVNNIHNLQWTIGGIIYMHDITRIRMGNVGTMSIRVLEQLTGADNWHNISLITSRWSTPEPTQGELLRERQLQENRKFWARMREASCQARICRFANTETSAKDIIDWHLDKKFVPKISDQMVNEGLTLGCTDAGKIIQAKYEAAFMQDGMTDRLAKMRERMDSRFQGQLAEVTVNMLLKDLHRLEQKQLLQRVGTWTARLTGYGGAVLATVLTKNPAAFKAALAAAGPLEMSFRRMKVNTRQQIEELRGSIASTVLYGQLDESASTESG